MQISIRIEGAEEVARRLAPAQYQQAIRAGITAGAQVYKGLIAQYPSRRYLTRREVYGRAFETPRQRRYFFWALRTGAIEVPYRRKQSRRSEDLGGSWTVAVPTWFRAIVGTNVSYAPLVQSRARQTRYHRAQGWRTVEDVAERDGGKVASAVERAFWQVARRIWR